MPVEQTTDAASLYLDLLKRSLTGALAEDNDSILGGVRTAGSTSLKRRLGNFAGHLASRVNVEIVYKKPYDPALREVGRDWPSRAESMIGLRRMENIEHCVQTVLDDDVPGDMIEAGVSRGGACIFMKANLMSRGDTSRVVWVADSFQGLPRPNTTLYPADTGDELHSRSGLSVGADQVRHNFERYGVLDDRVKFLVGWFKDTLPGAPIRGSLGYAPRWRHVRVDLAGDRGALPQALARGVLHHRRLRQPRVPGRSGDTRLPQGARDRRGDHRRRRVRRILAEASVTTVRRVWVLLLPFLPASLRRLVGIKVFGWDIHPTARIGRSIIAVRHVSMGPEANIGPFNVFRNLDELRLAEGASIGGRNWISAHPLTETVSTPSGHSSSLTMGEWSKITVGHEIDCTERVEIGDHAGIIGFRCQVLTHSMDLMRDVPVLSPVLIGHRSVVMSGCILLSGTCVPARLDRFRRVGRDDEIDQGADLLPRQPRRGRARAS